MKPQLNENEKRVKDNIKKTKNIKKQIKKDTTKQQDIQEQEVIKCRTQKNLCVSFH